MWVSWLVAVGCTIWLMWEISKTSLRLFFSIPSVILQDHQHPPVVPIIPFKPKRRRNKELWWLGMMLWVALLSTFALWLSGGGNLIWTILLEPAYFWLALSGGSLPSSFTIQLQQQFQDSSERQAWLALFEKQHPEWAALPPLLLQPYRKGFGWALAALVVPAPLLLQLVLSGYLLLAAQITLFFLFAMLTMIPLIRWAGVLVGGRTAWWVQYYLLRDDR